MFNLLNQKMGTIDSLEIDKIKDASANILAKTGVRINNDKILKILGNNGLNVNYESKIVKISEGNLYKYISLAKNKYTLYGRDITKKAEFGSGRTNIQSSSGQYMFYDYKLNNRRKPILNDLRNSAKVTNQLNNIDICGAFVVPSDVGPIIQDLRSLIELLQCSIKPLALWINNGKTAKYMIEVMKVMRDGIADLKDLPFCECFIEAISPLQYTKESMDILKVFAEEKLPIGFGPMAMQGGSAPVTIAGTIVQENVEILAGIVISQIINPGNPITYWGIAHSMDMGTGNISFGSPEKILLALGLIKVARSYGFKSVGVNLGLTDSNSFDSQSGFEKGVALSAGLSAGADILCHQGIVGQDSCASIEQLIIENEFLSYLNRIYKGYEVNKFTLFEEVINDVGIGGNHLTRSETLENFKNEMYLPELLNRENWNNWVLKDKKTILDKANYLSDKKLKEQIDILEIEKEKLKEIKNIYKIAEKELL